MIPFEMPVPEAVKETIAQMIVDLRAPLLEAVIEAIQPEIDQAWRTVSMELQVPPGVELEFPRAR